MNSVHKFVGTRRWNLTRWLLAGVGVGVALDVNISCAQAADYVITFDNVVVRGVDAVDTPEVAHREVPGLDTFSSTGETRSDPSGTRVDPAKKVAGTPAQLPKVSLRTPGSLLPFEPRDGHNNPSFVQEAILVEAFWAAKIGTPAGFFKRAHFHPPDLASGFEAQHLGNPNELHGLYIRSLDGKRFGLKSLRYRITRNRQMPAKPLSIEGFSNFNVNVLVARSFDPRSPVRAQFVPIPVGIAVGNDISLPWSTLRIFGFELVEQIYIASTASVDFDDIVLTRREPPAALESNERDK